MFLLEIRRPRDQVLWVMAVVQAETEGDAVRLCSQGKTMGVHPNSFRVRVAIERGSDEVILVQYENSDEVRGFLREIPVLR